MDKEKQQLVREIHRDARKYYQRRKFIMYAINETIQIDLIELQKFKDENNGNRYILIAIDVFSKMAFSEPQMDKTGPETTRAMRVIIRKFLDHHNQHMIKHIMSDAGKEFLNRTMKRMLDQAGIHHYVTFSNLKASIVERVIRTIKRQLYMAFSINGNYKWLDILQEIMDRYNDTW